MDAHHALLQIEVHANDGCNRAVAQVFKISTQPDAKPSVAWDRNQGKGLTFKVRLRAAEL